MRSPTRPGPPGPPSAVAPPLLVTGDADLLDHLLRLAAAAGVTPEVAPDVAGALASWSTAPAVVVGVDAADALARLAPGRRGSVHLVGLGAVPDHLYRTALAVGAESLLDLPGSDAWLVETLTDVADAGRRSGLVLGVVGGSGGVGATTFACALGQEAARRGEALVVDGDALGPGVDLLLGLETDDGARWDALGHTSGRLGARSLREAVPRRGGLGVLTWLGGGPADPPDPGAVREALSAAVRGHDVVVVDLPRHDGPVVGEVAARCDRLVLLVAASVTGVASAARVAGLFRRHRDLGLVVRDGPLEVDDVVAAVGAPALATMRDQRGLAELVDLGLGPARNRRGPLARAARAVLATPVATGAVLGRAAGAA